MDSKETKETKETKEEYEENYHRALHKNLLTNKKYYLFRAKCSNLFYWKFFGRRQGKFLDFGCGLGASVYLHRDKAIGVDASKFCIEECKKKGITAIENLEKLKGNEFIGILSVHTLEHLSNPLYYINQVHRILKKGGIFVLVLPEEDINRPAKSRQDIGKISPTHIYSWTFETINQLLIEAGFKIRHNRFLYFSGYSLFYKLPFKIATFCLQLLGKLRKKREMIIVAEK